MYCPKCGSQKIVIHKRGFSWRNGILGSLFMGDGGFLAGFIGSQDMVCECEYCGFVWKVSEYNE